MIPWWLVSVGIALAGPGPERPLWTLEFPGKRPTSAFFDAASGALFVSLAAKNGEGGTIAKVSLGGKVENKAFASSKGAPGPLRAYAGRIYWISGSQVQSKGGEGILTEGTVATELGDPTDIAIDRHGTVYVGTSAGNLVSLGAGEASAEQRGQPITGLFLLDGSLQILRGTRLQAITIAVSQEAASSSVPLCSKECRGLERTSAGKWLTVSGSKVLEVDGAGSSRTLYVAPDAATEIGRPAYVYSMDTTADFYVLPFPKAGKIQAFRVNAVSK